MPDYRRFYLPDAIVFVTCVTKNRYPYLKSRKEVNLFFMTLAKVNEIKPFKLLAFVILPDHFHWLMKVDDSSENFSKIMHSIQRNSTLNYKRAHNNQTPIKIWQRGFWDHMIRDENDLERHFDYIHWNPVKHGYIVKPEKWPYSTYGEWVGSGYYEYGWGWFKEPNNIVAMDFE